MGYSLLVQNTDITSSHSLLILGVVCLCWFGHCFGDVAVLDALKCLQTRRLYLEITLFCHQFFLLIFKIINLVSVGTGFGDLRQVNQAKDTQHYSNKNRVANRAQPAAQLMADRVLVAAPGALGAAAWDINR